MKKLYKVSIFIIFVICIGFIIFDKKEDKIVNISEVLNTSAYSYLPEEAKEYVKSVYESSGEVILTEKNKKKNIPYLNPSFVSYLSSEEKESYDLIPEPIITDFISSDVKYDGSLPSTFDLRSYTTSMKNQGNTGTCWTFAGSENAETFLRYKGLDTTSVFSPRQIDYVASSDGLYYLNNAIYDNSLNSSRTLGGGGNLYTLWHPLINGLSLYNESDFPFNEDITRKYAGDIINYDKSNYEVNSTLMISEISTDTASTEEINAYVNLVKQNMINYGAPYVGTVSPQSACGFLNRIDNKYVIKSDECESDAGGHAMQIVGWDDNYQYKYCDTGSVNTSTNTSGTCSSGTLKTGTGAWLVRNSWGANNSYEYVYLTYDSTKLELGFITDMSKMSDRTWDNNYYKTPFPNGTINGLMASSYIMEDFDTKSNNPEKIEKIKFFPYGAGTFNVTVYAGNHADMVSVTVNGAGYATADFSNRNLIADTNEISVFIMSDNGSYLVDGAVSVFTSNTNNEVVTKFENVNGFASYGTGDYSINNPLFITGNTKTIKYDLNTKNITGNDVVNIKVLNGEEDYTNYIVSNKYISNINGEIYTTFNANKETYSDRLICGNTFNYQLLINGNIVDSIPLKRICDRYSGTPTNIKTKSNITFHKNDGTNYTQKVSKDDLNNYVLINNTSNIYEYIGGYNNLFKTDKYIKSWNTDPNGTGTSYTNNNLYLFADTDLYAIWSTNTDPKHAYNIQYECDRYICHSTNIVSKKVSVNFNEDFIIPTNTFTNLDQTMKFIYYKDTNNNIYYEGETYNNLYDSNSLNPYQNAMTKYLSAVWSNNTHKITYKGGTNLDQTIYETNIIDNTSTRLKNNLFTKEGTTFSHWKDNNGNIYSNNEIVKLTSDLELTAVWEDDVYKVTFNSNGAGIDSTTQNVIGSSIKLNKNTFTRLGYIFSSWNTKSDGTGTSYLDEEEITVTDDITLYAIWTDNACYINLNNDGEITKIVTTCGVNYNFTYKAETKTGYTFKGWNTSSDGTGEGITKSQTMNLLFDVTYYAIWEANKYDIVYYKNNGLDNISEKYSYNSDYQIKENTFTREGYTFKNWNTKSDGTGTSYNENQIVKFTKTNMVLYAIWEGNEITITYKDGTNTTTKKLVVGSSDKIITCPFTKEGYTFKSWNTSSDGKGESYSSNTVNTFTKDTTLYAIWNINHYTVNYSTNSGYISVSNTYPVYNETIKVSLYPSEGKKLSKLIIYDNKGNDITSSFTLNDLELTFNMPSTDLVINAIFEDIVVPNPKITITKGNNNSLTININDQIDTDTYIIYRSTDKKKYTKIATINENTYTNTGLTYGKTYYYKVRAYNSSEKIYSKSYSNVVYKKVIPNTVTNLKYEAIGGTSVRMSYDKVSASGYEVYRSTNNKTWSKVSTITKNTTLTYTNKKLSTNKTYYYRVRAYKTVSGKKVYGSFSNIIKIKTAPTKAKMSISLRDYDSFNVKVSSISGATYYKLYKSLDNKTWTLEDFNTSGTNIDTNLIFGKTYYYKVRACNSYNACGSYSSTVKLKLTTKTPSFSLTTTSKKINIKVNPVNNATGYEIYRATSKSGKYTKLTEPNLETLTLTHNSTKGKTYYYKVRSYNITDGVKVYSPFSSIKSIKSK